MSLLKDYTKDVKSNNTKLLNVEDSLWVISIALSIQFV